MPRAGAGPPEVASTVSPARVLGALLLLILSALLPWGTQGLGAAPRGNPVGGAVVVALPADLQGLAPPPVILPEAAAEQVQAPEEAGVVVTMLEGEQQRDSHTDMDPLMQHMEPVSESEHPQVQAEPEQPAPAQASEGMARMPQSAGQAAPADKPQGAPDRPQQAEGVPCPLEHADDRDIPRPAAAGGGAEEAPEPAREQRPAGEAPIHIAAARAATGQQLQAASAGLQAPEAPVEAGQLLQELAERLSVSEQQGQKQLEIRLRPEHLGRVSIQLTLGEGGLQARIRAEDAGVRSAIQGQLGSLMEALSEKGVKVAGIEVVYAAVTGQDFDRPGPDQRGGEPREGRGDSPRRIGAPAEAAAPVQEALQALPDSGLSTVEYRV